MGMLFIAPDLYPISPYETQLACS